MVHCSLYAHENTIYIFFLCVTVTTDYDTDIVEKKTFLTSKMSKLRKKGGL